MDSATQDQIHTLWDELADFSAAGSDEALTCLMDGLCTLAGAWNALWMGAVRLDATCPADPAKGWRPRFIRYLHPALAFDDAAQEHKKLDQGVVDITTIRNLDNVGVFRANRLCDLVGPEWFESPYYQSQYRDCGIGDAIWVAFPVNEDAESWVGIYGAPDRPPFSETERDTVAYALRGLKWFHRQLMLSYGVLAAASSLTPTERRALRGLLTSLSEKQIASELGQSYHTTHEYVTAIYRKFGVNNRAALMALWLGKAV